MQRSILVEASVFRITISEYDKPIRTITRFSVGLQDHRTPLFEGGSLHRTKRDRHHISGSWPKPHGGAKMPFALFFTEEPSCAFHQGSSSVPSHGCIHLEPLDAQWLFEWAGSFPVGLTIRGPYPRSSVPPQKLYYFGASNMRGAVVEAIQTALRNAGHDPGPVDREFGDLTDKAVREFQTAGHFVVDGRVGRDTATALGLDWDALTALP